MEYQLKKTERPETGKLPDFIIGGIEKSGTTSLYANLAKHPNIEMSPNAFRYVKLGMMNIKESQFFSKRWSYGVKWYQSIFNDNDKLQGEAGTNYLLREEYIKRMSSLIPHAKIIVTLRNPVTRAYSAFNYFTQRFRHSLPVMCARYPHKKGVYIRTFKYFCSSFDDTIKKEINYGVTDGKGCVGKGLYINFFENLLKYYPRQQLLIVISEQMKQDMQGTYNQIFDFLAVERVKIDFNMDVNITKYEKSMSTISQEILKEFYGPYNERLFNFLGFRVPEWDMDRFKKQDGRASFYSQ